MQSPTNLPTKFENLLIKKDLIASDALTSLKVESLSFGKPLEQLLIERNILDNTKLLELKSELFGVPLINSTELIIPKNILSSFPEAAAVRYKALPFKDEGGKVHVAMSDPQDLTALEFLRKSYGKPVEPYLVSDENFEHIISEQYSRSLGLAPEVSSALQEAAGEVTKITERISNIASAEQTIRDAPVARVISTILEYAVKAKASDIHIEPEEERTRIRYRIDGILSERLTVPKSVHNALVSRVKILSHLKLDEKRKPQDGRFKIEYANKRIDLRISILPTVFGEKVVIRLLKDEASVLDFPKLGFTGISLKRIEHSMKDVNGIILVTGPTGSGKTVTLATALSKVNNVKVNITTLEDPVEIRIQGVNHTQVNPGVGLSFADGLRSILRQDPNIIMVGEIRDVETAELAVHAALTGHLVLSTLHTNSAAGALPRLLDMGIEAFLLSSTVNYIVGQRLARKICEKCKTSEDMPAEVWEDIEKVLGPLYTKKTEGPPKFYKGLGCDSCGKTGYSGRVGIFEVLAMSQKISKLVLERSPENVIEKEAVNEGMVTLVQDGYLKVLEGITTLEEVLRVARE